MTRRMVKLSATALSAFKACPMRYNLRYVKGITTAEEKASLRYGSAWHKVLEILSLIPGDVCPECAKTKSDPACLICGGTDSIRENLMDVASWVLAKIYEEKEGMDPDQAELEQVQILYAATMYIHLYRDRPITVLEREQKFSLPLVGGGGRALPNVVVDGVIDKVVQVELRKLIMEHKTTSKSVDAGSDYWDHLALDTQISMYVWAANKIDPDAQIRGVYYDVFHKPGISPKAITQSESAEFVESGKYCGQEFEVNRVLDNEMLEVNGVVATVTPGKKPGTFAIRETAEMYGARLMQDIAERPEFYFARREIARTEADIEQFEKQLRNIYISIRSMEKDDAWFCNEQQCQATFKCEFCALCYNNVKIGDEIPEGYKSTFTEKSDASTAKTSA